MAGIGGRGGAGGGRGGAGGGRGGAGGGRGGVGGGRGAKERSSVAYGGGAFFADEGAGAETVQAERGDDPGGAAVGDALGHGLAGDRAGLEAVGAPADVEQETADRGGAHHGREVRGHVAQAGPLAQHADLAQGWHQLEYVTGQALDELQRAAHRVGRERVDASAEHELAALGLADVDVQRAGHDDRGQERLHRLGHRGLQRGGGNRQCHSGQVRDQRGPAGGGVEDDPGGDAAAAGADPGDLVPDHVDGGDLGPGVDVHAERAGGASVAPDHGVVPDDAAGRVPQRAQHRVAGGRADVDRRGQPLDLGGPDHLGV